MQGRAKSAKGLATSSVEAIVPVVAMGILVLAHGGFFALATSLMGLALCVAAACRLLRRSHRRRRLDTVCLLFVLVALAYAFSSVANGLTLTTLSETGSWAACAGMALWSASQEERDRNQTLELIGVLGCFTAILGIAVYVGLVVLPDGMTGARLQMTFQYANAAGAWYAAMALVGMQASDVRLRRLVFLPLSCLLLTQSVGSIVVYALLAIYQGWLLVRQDDCERLANFFAQALLAVAVFCLATVLRHPLTVLPLAAIVLAWHRWGDVVTTRLERIGTQHLGIAGSVCAAAVILLAVLVFPARLAQAAATFVERGYHIHDGFVMALMRPLFGVGPDNWQYLYRLVQSAQYTTSVVHCSYVQVLVDSGFVGCLLLVAACVMGLWRLASRRKDRTDTDSSWMVALFLAIHALVDFDLQFAAISFLFAWMIVSPSEAGASEAGAGHFSPRPSGLTGALLGLFVCLPLCVAGALSSLYASSLERAYAQEDHAAFHRLYETNPLAYADRAAQELDMTIAYDEGEYRYATKIFKAMSNPSDTCALVAARAFYALDEREEGALALIELMEDQPYNVDYMQGVRQFFEEEGLDTTLMSRYHAAVVHANDLAGRVNRLLQQEQLEDTLP